MEMLKGEFPDVAGILEAIEATTATTEQTIGPLPAETLDHEHKYDANGANMSIHDRMIEFHHTLYELSRVRNKFTVIDGGYFAGVDECFELIGPPGHDEIVMHRLRFGSNRSCRLTTKVRSKSGNNSQRFHVNIQIAYKDYRGWRAALTRTAHTAHGHRHIFVAQSGGFWFVRDTENHRLVELVAYKVARVAEAKTNPPRLFIEIAPRGCAHVEEAIVVIKKYEDLLGISGNRIERSNMEIFSEQ